MHIPCLSAEHSRLSARTIHDVRIVSQLHFIRIRDCHEKIITS